MTLVEFLRARLDEDEEDAKAAQTAEPWWSGNEDFDEDAGGNLVGDGQSSVNEGDHLPPRPVLIFAERRAQPPYGYAVVDHAARWHPARVLAEVEAKRQILEAHSPHQGYADPITFCITCDSSSASARGGDYPCETVRLLALPYADHPDYDLGWKP